MSEIRDLKKDIFKFKLFTIIYVLLIAFGIIGTGFGMIWIQNKYELSDWIVLPSFIFWLLGSLSLMNWFKDSRNKQMIKVYTKFASDMIEFYENQVKERRKLVH